MGLSRRAVASLVLLAGLGPTVGSAAQPACDSTGQPFSRSIISNDLAKSNRSPSTNKKHRLACSAEPARPGPLTPGYPSPVTRFCR